MVRGELGGGWLGWGLQSPDFLTLPLSDTCERSAGSLCLSTLLCNHKVQMTPPAACSLHRAALKPHSLVSEAQKNPLKSQPDQKDGQSQDSMCSHLGLSMTGQRRAVV